MWCGIACFSSGFRLLLSVFSLLILISDVYEAVVFQSMCCSSSQITRDMLKSLRTYENIWPHIHSVFVLLTHRFQFINTADPNHALSVITLRDFLFSTSVEEAGECLITFQFLIVQHPTCWNNIIVTIMESEQYKMLISWSEVLFTKFHHKTEKNRLKFHGELS